MDDIQGTRPMRSPTKDWLTLVEVVRWFDISETTLTDWISRGLFPTGIQWTGKDRRWRWIDVVYREIYLEIQSRLSVESESPGTTLSVDPESPGIPRQSPAEPGRARNSPK